jgi:alkylhydroperoxidase/carboxymuconolactone decarboxylase family protein YurZ
VKAEMFGEGRAAMTRTGAEFVFGDIVSKRALDLKTRELLSLAMRAAIRDAGRGSLPFMFARPSVRARRKR